MNDHLCDEKDYFDTFSIQTKYYENPSVISLELAIVEVSNSYYHNHVKELSI